MRIYIYIWIDIYFKLIAFCGFIKMTYAESIGLVLLDNPVVKGQNFVQPLAVLQNFFVQEVIVVFFD